MIMSPCEEHGKIVDVLHRLDSGLPLMQKDMEYLRRDQEVILARFGKHVEDAEKEGGRHERLHNVEQDIKTMKEQRRNDIIMIRWFMVGSGFIGGMMGAGAPEAFLGIARVMGIIK